MTYAWLPFLLLGLGGSVHCMGMCGGFAVLVGDRARKAGRLGVREQLAYVLGKTLTYVVLGVALAVAADLALRGGVRLSTDSGLHRSHVLEGWRSVVAWAAGLWMIALGATSLGLRLPTGRFGRAAFARIAGHARRLFENVRSLPGLGGPFGVGVVTGFLPCGLSWGALALAVASPPPVAALGMLSFGLATGPALALVGLGWSSLAGRWRTLAARAAGPALIVFGLLTLIRGGVPDSILFAQEALPSCCRSEAGH